MLMSGYPHSLSLDATIMASENCPIIGEHVVIILSTHKVMIQKQHGKSSYIINFW